MESDEHHTTNTGTHDEAIIASAVSSSDDEAKNLNKQVELYKKRHKIAKNLSDDDKKRTPKRHRGVLERIKRFGSRDHLDDYSSEDSKSKAKSKSQGDLVNLEDSPRKNKMKKRRFLKKEKNQHGSSSDEEDFTDEIRKTTNEYRKIHGVKSLLHSKELSSYAREWVKKAARDEDTRLHYQKKYGQAAYKIARHPHKKLSAGDVVDNWYEEIHDYLFVNEEANFEKKTENFTQLIWKDTKEIGVAKASTSDRTIIYVTAFFYPKGNIKGSYSHQVSPVGGFPRDLQKSDSSDSASTTEGKKHKDSKSAEKQKHRGFVYQLKQFFLGPGHEERSKKKKGGKHGTPPDKKKTGEKSSDEFNKGGSLIDEERSYVEMSGIEMEVRSRHGSDTSNDEKESFPVRPLAPIHPQQLSAVTYPPEPPSVISLPQQPEVMQFQETVAAQKSPKPDPPPRAPIIVPPHSPKDSSFLSKLESTLAKSREDLRQKRDDRSSSDEEKRATSMLSHHRRSQNNAIEAINKEILDKTELVTSSSINQLPSSTPHKIITKQKEEKDTLIVISYPDKSQSQKRTSGQTTVYDGQSTSSLMEEIRDRFSITRAEENSSSDGEKNNTIVIAYKDIPRKEEDTKSPSKPSAMERATNVLKMDRSDDSSSDESKHSTTERSKERPRVPARTNFSSTSVTEEHVGGNLDTGDYKNQVFYPIPVKPKRQRRKKGKAAGHSSSSSSENENEVFVPGKTKSNEITETHHVSEEKNEQITLVKSDYLDIKHDTKLAKYSSNSSSEDESKKRKTFSTFLSKVDSPRSSTNEISKPMTTSEDEKSEHSTSDGKQTKCGTYVVNPGPEETIPSKKKTSIANNTMPKDDLSDSSDSEPEDQASPILITVKPNEYDMKPVLTRDSEIYIRKYSSSSSSSADETQDDTVKIITEKAREKVYDKTSEDPDSSDSSDNGYRPEITLSTFPTEKEEQPQKLVFFDGVVKTKTEFTSEEDERGIKYTENSELTKEEMTLSPDLKKDVEAVLLRMSSTSSSSEGESPPIKQADPCHKRQSSSSEPEENELDNVPLTIAGRESDSKLGTKTEIAAETSVVNILNTFFEEVLSFINYYRGMHVAAPLSMDYYLCSIARKRAEKLLEEFQFSLPKHTLGEIIYSVTLPNPDHKVSAKTIVEEWYDTKRYYIHGTEPEQPPKSGPFCQMVWTDSREIGLGALKSDDGHRLLLVAIFKPGGNVPRQYQQQISMPLNEMLSQTSNESSSEEEIAPKKNEIEQITISVSKKIHQRIDVNNENLQESSSSVSSEVEFDAVRRRQSNVEAIIERIERKEVHSRLERSVKLSTASSSGSSSDNERPKSVVENMVDKIEKRESSLSLLDRGKSPESLESTAMSVSESVLKRKSTVEKMVEKIEDKSLSITTESAILKDNSDKENIVVFTELAEDATQNYSLNKNKNKTLEKVVGNYDAYSSSEEDEKLMLKASKLFHQRKQEQEQKSMPTISAPNKEKIQKEEKPEIDCENRLKTERKLIKVNLSGSGSSSEEICDPEFRAASNNNMKDIQAPMHPGTSLGALTETDSSSGSSDSSDDNLTRKDKKNYTEKMLKATNEYRVDCEVGDIKLSKKLCRIARRRGKVISSDDEREHSHKSYGEIIYSGEKATPAEVVAKWIKKMEDNLNDYFYLASSETKRMGISITERVDGTIIVVVLFYPRQEKLYEYIPPIRSPIKHAREWL